MSDQQHTGPSGARTGADAGTGIAELRQALAAFTA